MKSISIFLFVTGLLMSPKNGQSQKLTVIIKNIKDDKGNVGAALYNSEQDFMKKIWQAKSTKAKPGEVQLVFENVPAGTYAISVMHDANENGKLDSNLIGIPLEGFGFSNNALGKFGPPGFEKAKFVCGGKDQGGCDYLEVLLNGLPFDRVRGNPYFRLDIGVISRTSA